MIEAANCVICDGELRLLHQALVAPFLAKRIWGKAPFCVNLVQCTVCGFMCYNPRLDATEEGRLYTNYRSEEYQRLRHSSEPWYTARFNASLASTSSYEIRRRTLAALLREHIGKREIKRILDYGGDHGDLVCGLIAGAAAFVYDISGVPAVAGVTAVTDPAACQADLIINSNVLEHVGFPRCLIENILKAAPPGGLVYLEVPCESPFGLKRIVRRIAQIGIMAVTRPALALSVVRPASLYMMHEHINYFAEQPLTTLMRKCGASIVASGTYFVNGMTTGSPLAWCLACAPQAATT